MFVMIDQAAARSEERRLRTVLTAGDIVAMAVFGAAVFFIVAMAFVGSVIFVLFVRPCAGTLARIFPRRPKPRTMKGGLSQSFDAPE
jgi:hypothetical protein